MPVRGQGMEDGVAEFVRKEGANGFDPKGAYEACEVYANGHAEPQAAEGHGVAEGGRRARAARVEEEEKENAEKYDIGRVDVGVQKAIDCRMDPDPQAKIRHAKQESRDGIDVRMSSEVHSRNEHARGIPNDAKHQQHLHVSFWHKLPNPITKEH